MGCCEFANGIIPPVPFERAQELIAALQAITGIYTSWIETRGTKQDPVEGNHTIYGFLRTERNAIVAPVQVERGQPQSTLPEKQARILMVQIAGTEWR